MKHKAIIVIMFFCSLFSFAVNANDQIAQEVQQLQLKTRQLQAQVNQLQRSIHRSSLQKNKKNHSKKARQHQAVKVQSSKQDVSHADTVQIRVPDNHLEALEFYPTALMAENQVITYIAGTPVVTAPYLGARPAFDGSDYIVNISSINRDVRLLEQRRRLYYEYRRLGYPQPDVPILMLSGKVEPLGSIDQPYSGTMVGGLTLGSSELDAAAAINDMVEGYIALAYNGNAQMIGAPRVANSSIGLNMGFVNIGNLDKSPVYFTGGQLFVPFGRFSTSMPSATLPMILGRTKARPFILGYKSQEDHGPFAAIYGFQGDTLRNGTGVGGVNLGYVFNANKARGEVGVSYISSIDNSAGMQLTGSIPGTTFGGFASFLNGNENVKKIPGVDVHGYINFDRYSITAEWVSAAQRFRPQDLSFNGQGALPQAGQVEGAITFMAFNRPSSIAVGYQWSKDALALNLPAQRVNGVFNISIWRDTVESLEYRHDMDYRTTDYANGAAPVGMTNLNTIGTGHVANTILAQIGVYF